MRRPLQGHYHFEQLRQKLPQKQGKYQKGQTEFDNENEETRHLSKTYQQAKSFETFQEKETCISCATNR